ncbi:SDR family oxidoreductase [Amycolatopsis sp.]|uniref:SDR family NAD(P)-dependent oxidoreductase n=1 Tax=Amycolatopsis sp. TaxID=37632 RepID=UPI002BD25584|nr:SDR family oxidoreductase [Amycolatopsis sp.]HVV08123.1 SDR family oxidoreductase [Amycolatopsis sp.]
MGNEAKVALVTGASRGIGKAIAIHLARNGFDVAIGARTRQEGEAREHSPTVRKSDVTPLPGSLESTAREIEKEGRRALGVYVDLLDRTSLGSAVSTVLERWGGIDVLVNNGRYIGPGHMDRFLDAPVELIERQIQANAISPLYLTRLVLPSMIERGSGIVLNITSGCAVSDPPAAIGEGGWGLGYGMSKAAIHRQAGILAKELAGTGVLFFNIEPGLIGTERMAIDMASYGFDAATMTPPDVIGAVAAWLVGSPDSANLNGQTIDGQQTCRELGLLPGWPVAS